MRPPRLIFLLLCFICLPIFLTTVSLISAHPRRDTNGSVQGRASRLRALFSFHAPSSLFPPSAIISLTDDNSTFFLARPAAFGPVLPPVGLSGQLWIGNGFGDDSLRKGGVTAGVEGELGCSDVPGWGEGDKLQNADLGTSSGNEKVHIPKTQSGTGGDTTSDSTRRKRSDETVSDILEKKREVSAPTENDGTDDHLHHPLPDSGYLDTPNPTADKSKSREHADIQSLQESAEISGRVVLLSRGGCGFLEKVKWVQRRGGTALIVGDNSRGGNLVTMYARGDTSNVTIPAIFTSQTTAHLLSSLIPPETIPENTPDNDLSTNLLGSKSSKKSNDKATVTAVPSPKPSATPRARMSNPSPTPPPKKKGWLRSIFSHVGLLHDDSYPPTSHEDSRRPPSSGNLHWSTHNNQEDRHLPSNPKYHGHGNKERGSSDDIDRNSSNELDPHLENDDDFIIGVQDWRDPDLVPAKTATAANPTSTPKHGSSNEKYDRDHVGNRGNNPDSSAPKGGSITPGSGEYASPYKTSNSKGSSNEVDIPSSSGSKAASSRQSGHWWSRLFGRPKKDNQKVDDSEKSTLKQDKTNAQSNKKTEKPSSSEQKDSTKNAQPEHEGLWVTLTPTSMSTSPFIDTLLVLVVSPLVTLTVVYALLLLRSRIRRRRWRAPKAVVDRLPVRTYHTIPSGSPSINSPHTITPRSSSPSSPLLSHSQPRNPHSRTRSLTTSGTFDNNSHSIGPGNSSTSNNAEKPSSGPTLWRRRYTGRQVECVVCLEEYIDGHSRVMSLPCGHEFHAECM